MEEFVDDKCCSSLEVLMYLVTYTPFILIYIYLISQILLLSNFLTGLIQPLK